MTRLKRCVRFYCGTVSLVLIFQFGLLALIKSNSSQYSQFNAQPIFSALKSMPLVDFKPSEHTLVLFHMQKTSGTSFSMQLVNELLLVNNENKSSPNQTYAERVCAIKRVIVRDVRTMTGKMVKWYECNGSRIAVNSSKSLLHSWHTSFGWSCGLHPGLSDLRRCLEAKNYSNPDRVTRGENFLYMSILREPVRRFLSEWRHVSVTGSTWFYELDPKSADQVCLKSKPHLKNLFIHTYICSEGKNSFGLNTYVFTMHVLHSSLLSL
jgi:hypothetical protein